MANAMRQQVDLVRPGDLPACPLVIAHRGYSCIAPENTLAAFEAALEAGADLLELDLHVSADGHAVVIHDESLDRTTDASGAVAELSLEQIRTADAGSWFAPEFTGQQVPTLVEVVDLLGRYRTSGAFFEFKGTWSAQDLHAAVDVIRKGGVAQASLLQGFERATVASLRQVAPDIRRGLLTVHPDPLIQSQQFYECEDPFVSLGAGTGLALAQGLDAAIELGAAACNPYIGTVMATPGLIDEYHAAGVQVFSWTVDDPQLWEALTVTGVDGIITNDAGGLRRFLDARTQLPVMNAPVHYARLARLAVTQGRVNRAAEDVLTSS